MVGDQRSRRSFSTVLVINLVYCFCIFCALAEDACDAGAKSSSPAMLQTQSARDVTSRLVNESNKTDPEFSPTSNHSNISNGSAIIAMVDACLQNHITGDQKEQSLWDLVRTAEILSKLMAANICVKALGSDWPDDTGVIEAAMVSGRDAAEALVKKEFEAETERILGSANLTQKAIDHFTEKLAKMAEMCGDSSEAERVAEDEASIMHSGNMTLEEARVAKDLADYVEGLCQSDVLDLDFFVGRLANESPECNALVAETQLLQMQKHLSVLDFYAKSALVLHDEKNKLGHHFAKRLHKHQREETREVEPLLMKAALQHGSSKPRMARLFYLDRLYYDKIHGFTKNQYCDSNFQLQKEQPEHWISQNQEIQAYVDCLCVKQQPSLWCDAHHAEPLALLQPKVVQDMQEASRKLNSLLQTGSAVGVPVGLGPCQDADGTPAAFDCSFCVNGDNCIITSGSYSLDVFGSIKELMGTSASCVKGYCTPCKGIKPGDPFQFKLDIGVDVSKCGSTADFLATYNYFAELKLCIGGILGEASSKMGWALCQSLGKVTYHPFISKLHFSMSLPIPLPPPIGVRASLAVNLNLGDISQACDNHCSTFGPSQNFRCLEEFYAARGVTGVDFKVEVLLGVSIPFVGTIGKWFKVLGFDFAEDDNSREIAKNKAGVTIEYIGPSPWRQICGRAFSGVNCEPYAGDQDNRANEDCRNCGDDFNIWRADPNNPRSLCIRRDDYNGGWGMNLEIACPVDNNNLKVIVPIGSSSVNTKCAMPDEPVQCRADGGNQGVRLGFDTYSDSYSVYQDGHRWCARRTDHGGGWGLNLQLECDPTGGSFGFQVRNIHMGSSGANMKCLLITHEMRCDAHTADSAYRTNDDCRHCGDSFYVSVDNPWGYVCARRTDYHGGWGLNLWFNCNSIQDNVRIKRDVHIGSSGSNTRCVWGGSSNIICASYAGNSGYRRNNDPYGDSFEISTSGGNVCARRTDYHGGWGLDLQISCIDG